MVVLNDNDEQILKDYLCAYKECFEAQNNLLCEIVPRVELTKKEIELAEISDMKYKNMIYHMRKWNPNFKRLS